MAAMAARDRRDTDVHEWMFVLAAGIAIGVFLGRLSR
jgi:hypothetical protein